MAERISDRKLAKLIGNNYYMLDGREQPSKYTMTRDHLRALIDAATPVAVQEEGDAWQPIETAPKDGKEFLAIWERQGNLMQVVRWNTVHKFYQAKGEPILGFSSNATAWQPLPSPPAAMKGDQP